jgi:putative tryptophan/tyrosine transport system substrate-binding protein
MIRGLNVTILAHVRPGRRPAVCLLGTNQSNWSSWTAAFVERLRDLGWIEGHNLSINYRWTEGRPDRITEMATEFVRLKVDVIVSYGTAISSLPRLNSHRMVAPSQGRPFFHSEESSWPVA